MITAKLKSLVRGQRGFTLIELLIAVAITALVTGSIASVFYQVITGNAQSGNHITAVRQVQNAGFWITRDGQQAQMIDDTPSGADEFLILTWNDWTAGTDHTVVYTIVGNELIRSVSVNGAPATVSIVARFIDTGNTSVIWDEDGNVLTLTVTATVSGFKVASETREYLIVPRPSL